MPDSVKALYRTWLWTSAADDLLISLALAYTLHRRIAHFSEVTDCLLKRLITTSLQTAACKLLSVEAAKISCQAQTRRAPQTHRSSVSSVRQKTKRKSLPVPARIADLLLAGLLQAPPSVLPLPTRATFAQYLPDSHPGIRPDKSMLEQSAALTDAFAGPLPALHAISLYTTLSTRRAISETLSGTGKDKAGPTSGSMGNATKNNSPGEGQAIKLGDLTFKRGKSVGSDSEPVVPTHALQFEPQQLPPRQITVQQERAISFDARSEYDEEQKLEKSRL